MILGLDISTSITGATILDENGNIIENIAWDTRKYKNFFQKAEYITRNWKKVRSEMLVSCHDEYPSTDLVYAMAYRMIDPTKSKLIDYEWFKFLHHKPAINKLTKVKDQNNYLFPNKNGDAIFLGDKRVSRVWHYNQKDINVRTT